MVLLSKGVIIKLNGLFWRMLSSRWTFLVLQVNLTPPVTCTIKAQLCEDNEGRHGKGTDFLLLFPVDHDTHDFFATFRVTFLMPRVCFKQIKWYIEMHHVRTFFSVWCHGFFALRDVHSQRVYQEESLPPFLSCRMHLKNRSEFILIIFYLQLINR